MKVAASTAAAPQKHQEQATGQFTFRGRLLSALGLTCVFVSACLLIPFPSTIVPPQQVRVVDSTGAPVANILVRQYWSHGPLDVEGRKDMRTNNMGVAVFDGNEVRASVFQRTIAIVREFRTYGIHGSYEARSQIQVASRGLTGWLEYDGSQAGNQVELIVKGFDEAKHNVRDKNEGGTQPANPGETPSGN